MEPQNQPVNLNSQPTIESAKKCKHMPIIIILAILAIGGLGFGGYGFWQSMQKDNEKSTIEAKLAEEKNKNQELQTQIDELKKEPVQEGGTSESEELKPENIKMAIDSSGELLVLNISTNRILANADQKDFSAFFSCDSGTAESRKENPVIICVLEKNNKEQVKFVYNYQTNTLSHN